jgi:hypothetical protein
MEYFSQVNIWAIAWVSRKFHILCRSDVGRNW